MKLIIGLGNPGEKYDGTRHNIGFAVLDHFAEQNSLSDWKKKDKLKSLVIEFKDEAGDRIVLAKPQTFMNLSGEAAQALKQFYKAQNSGITVVHDEVDLPFGEIREKTGGGSAGHNGVQSVANHIGEDFNRIRIGVRNEFTDDTDTSQFVLSKFNKDEVNNTTPIFNEAINSIEAS